MRIARTLAWLFTGLLLWPQAPERIEVGPLPGGGILLNSAWILYPAGRQIAVDSFPISSALSPDGRYLLVLHAGLNAPSIAVLDVAGLREISRTPVPDAWLGLAFAPGGNRVYVGGASQAAVYEFAFADGNLRLARTLPLVEPARRTPQDFAGDVALSPDGRLLYVAELFRNSVAVINPQSGRLIERFKTGRRPYRILFHPDGRSLFVSSWADGVVLRHEAEQGELMSRIRIAPHPTEMLWLPGRPKTDPDEEPSPYVGRIFVAASNTNSVYVLGVTESNDVQPLGPINVALTPEQPAGMTPSALASARGEARVFVACSDANAVAVIDATYAKPIVQGMLPAGWYPSSVQALPGGGLAVINAKGEGSPLRGSVSFLSIPDLNALEGQTRAVLENTPYSDSLLEDAGIGETGPIPSRPGGRSPIEHVFYVIKGGLTYDEVFGALPQGRGQASLARFNEQTLPNHFALAREFLLLDNFYRNGDQYSDGLNWSLAGIASDFVQKLAPSAAAGRLQRNDFQGGEPAAYPPAGYLWNNAAQAGVPVRNFGCFPQEPSVRPYSAPEPQPEGEAPDTARARVFLNELQSWEKDGPVPRLVTLCLSGAQPADNDRALGMIAEGVSHSRLWPKAAVFVVEAGGPFGKDHVSPYRSPAFVLSPYARRRATDSSFYNTTSVLRTIELILGLRPMSHFDAAARPLGSCFQAQPDLTPFRAAAHQP